VKLQNVTNELVALCPVSVPLGVKNSAVTNRDAAPVVLPGRVVVPNTVEPAAGRGCTTSPIVRPETVPCEPSGLVSVKAVIVIVKPLPPVARVFSELVTDHVMTCWP
jgi:hypothetical protein